MGGLIQRLCSSVPYCAYSTQYTRKATNVLFIPCLRLTFSIYRFNYCTVPPTYIIVNVQAYLNDFQSVGRVLVRVLGVHLHGDVILPAELLRRLPRGVDLGDVEANEGALDEALPRGGRPRVRPSSGREQRRRRDGGGAVGASGSCCSC